VFDPKRFPFAPDTHYVPSGQELGDAEKLRQVFDAYGVRNALVVGPNSGYGTDNRCLLDAIARAEGRFRGMAVVPNEVSRADLARLRDAGILGITFNATALGTDYYEHTEDLLALLTELDMFVDIQGERDQLSSLAPLVGRSGARILIDHCGRPDPDAGLHQAAFQAVLALARTGLRQAVRLRQVLARAVPVPGHVALCAGADRCLRLGRMRLGVGLAVPAGPGARRLRPAALACRAPGPGRYGSPHVAVGDAPSAVRILRVNALSIR